MTDNNEFAAALAEFNEIMREDEMLYRSDWIDAHRSLIRDALTICAAPPSRQDERARALEVFNAGYISMRDLGGHKGDNIFIYQFKGYQAKAIEDALYALSQPVQEGK